MRQKLSEEAKDRQRASGGDRKSPRAKSVPVNLPEPVTSGDARDQTGKAFGISGKSVDHAARVLNSGTEKLKRGRGRPKKGT